MKLKFLGHAVWYIESGEFKAIIDPFITGNPLCPVKVEDIGELSHIFVTHGHGDHMGDTVELAKRTGATVISNAEIITYLNQFNLNTHMMHIGGRVKLDFGTIKMTPALHGSGIETESGGVCGGNPGGFVIEVEGKKIYHAGDTGLTLDMKLLECEEIDVAMLPIGGNFTMDAVDAARAVKFIKPKLTIPMHYATFPILSKDATEFEELVDRRVKVLEPGDELSI